jgi:hypothetical protein
VIPFPEVDPVPEVAPVPAPVPVAEIVGVAEVDRLGLARARNCRTTDVAWVTSLAGSGR